MTGFPEPDYPDRWARAQGLMARAGIDAVLVTTEPEIRWLTGFLTRFWESPTRPWFVILPVAGAPVAVIPQIGVHLMAQGPVEDIRSWTAPDYIDDGVSLLAAALAETVPPKGTIGVPAGAETHLRMPLSTWEALQKRLPQRRFRSDADIFRRLRMVKDAAEIARLRAACTAAGRAFDRLPERAGAGMPLAQVFREAQILLLEEGAEHVPYIAGGAGPGGYGDVISPATDRALAAGDVLMIDTGATVAGYFCDFDRNYSVGPPAADLRRSHATLIEATRAGFAAARPGAICAEVFHAMDRVLTGGAEPPGRLGHGLGMQLTEPPSLLPADTTLLVPGMVLTLEPVLETGPDRLMVHEENILVTENGAEWLSPPQPPDIRRLEA